jgi:GeoRSP system PqqD family protein
LKIYRNPDVMWREEDEYKEQALEGLEKGDDVEDVGTSVLYSGGQMLSLNLLGTEIWKLCDGRTIDEIVSALVESFEVEPEVLRNDVTAFVDELKEKKFIRYEE